MDHDDLMTSLIVLELATDCYQAINSIGRKIKDNKNNYKEEDLIKIRALLTKVCSLEDKFHNIFINSYEYTEWVRKQLQKKGKEK